MATVQEMETRDAWGCAPVTVQEMAAVVCVYPSGSFDIVSAHFTRHDAVDALARMREDGGADEWHGRLLVACNGTVHAHVNLDKLAAYAGVDFGGIESDEGYDDDGWTVDPETGYVYER